MHSIFMLKLNVCFAQYGRVLCIGLFFCRMTSLTDLEPLAKRLKVETGAPVSSSSSHRGNWQEIFFSRAYD